MQALSDAAPLHPTCCRAVNGFTAQALAITVASMATHQKTGVQPRFLLQLPGCPVLRRPPPSGCFYAVLAARSIGLARVLGFLIHGLAEAGAIDLFGGL